MSRRLALAWVGVRRLALVGVLAALLLGVGDRDGPQGDKLPELDVLLVLDNTTSMSAVDDPSGSRVVAARRDLLTFADELESARFTLITVGRSAQVELPPTSDRVALETVLDRLPVEAADAGDGSSSDRAVPTLEELLAQDRGSGRLPVLVYAGDGEDNGDDASLGFYELGERFAAALVLGYGTEEGGTMPLVLTDGGARDRNVPDPSTGQDAISRANPTRLVKMADQVQGAYVDPSSAADVREAAQRLQRSAYDSLPVVEPERQLGWVWGLALLVLALPELRGGWRTWLAGREAS